ncbi:MAG: penicillin-binding protein, partial [Oscillospiraceae bacterium]|nr:penicillin-binding protein [Oscillospiraceae bacterium]
MTKIKRRALSVLILILLISAGLGLFLYRYFTSGETWASFSANQTAYENGKLTRGRITDRNGKLLLRLDEDGYHYSDRSITRKSTLHVLGDRFGNIGTGAVILFKEKLTGYDPVQGLYDSDEGGRVVLSINADLNDTAYQALKGRKGVVAVADCSTGEILTLVSAPSFDPDDPPDSMEDSAYEGAYLNRFLSAAFTPGSIYKLLTTAAALETLPNFAERSYTCQGSMTIGPDVITCMGNHGTISAKEALAVSCNCAFAQIALEVGSDTLEQYASLCSLTQGIEINGISCANGKFDISDADCNIAWSGIGQFTDLICPASMLRFVSAIANHGLAPELSLLKIDDVTAETRILKQSTADILKTWMNNNVNSVYGAERFPGMTVYAKSGTAEQGGDSAPHAWFVGFAEKDDRTLSFLVLVENGVYGSPVAGDVAS